MPYNADNQEKEILDFWEKHKTFEKSIQERPTDKPYVFYDGPPFATGLPHYGHIVASLMKDVVPRYFTMCGYRVERVWGWDCHGLPIENIVEKELGTSSKKEIEAMGIAKFNELCRSKVLSYVTEWEKTITRLGRWVDMPAEDVPASGGEPYGTHGYRTMDLPYMESVWWVFKQLWDKDLIYQGYRSMHICPRCETTLSQQEVSEGYKDVKDLSVVGKFKVKSKKLKETVGVDGEVYMLAWTTTPWTLPGNVLLAVGEDIDYSIVSFENAQYIVAKERLEDVFDGKEYTHIKDVSGNDLVGLTYKPLFPYFQDTKNAFRVVAADFVTTDEGTGVVHIAPAFGEDDYQVGQREKVGWVQHVSMDGRFTDDVTDFAGMQVKPKDDRTATDVEMIKYLAKNNFLFSKQKFEHSYPHCWRCDTPLLNYVMMFWFVAVTKVKDEALKHAKQINWSPAHIKEGRFGKWLEGARDWSISRQRFWASVMPIWECDSRKYKVESIKFCDNRAVFGSVAELEKASGKKVDDLHKHVVDEITFPCEKCDGVMRRIPDVLDTWFDSGSMPYAQVHYPFENKEKFEQSFPAEFIAEGQDQTRAWFYYLHVIGTAVKNSNTFQNVIVNGIVLAEDGKKMSKKLQNYPDPNQVLEKYGADALRYYLVTSPVMHAENLNFSEDGVREMYNKLVNTVWNVLTFYRMFEESQKSKVKSQKSEHVLDTWILARLNQLVQDVTEHMEAYELAEAARPIVEFVSDLSQWYVRRSRDRFKGDDEEDKQAALATLGEVLLTLAKVMAPFTPFIAEKIYQFIANSSEPIGLKESVHLERWPSFAKASVGKPGESGKILEDMELVRKITEMGHALRKEAGIPVRQPLCRLQVTGYKLQEELLALALDELNIKEVTQKTDGDSWVTKEEQDVSVALDTNITDELKQEGLSREIVRTINQKRKEQKLTRDDRIVVEYSTDDPLLQSVLEEYADEIAASVLADSLEKGAGEAMQIDGRDIALSVKKV